MKHQQLSNMNEYDRPLFHLTPAAGWMNDPNGFSRYGGKYHLFYQCYPEAVKWGPTSWGHAVSEDLIRWQRLPAALEPGKAYDSGGCFSGTAIDTGEHMIMYTGFRPDPDETDHRGFQTQCMAFGDGLAYRKYEGNPVITGDDLPDGGDPHEFRDPKLWREEDGTFRAIVANYNADRGAQLLLYASVDGLSWTFRKVLIENRDRRGWMWECPDFFPMGSKQILIASTMGDVQNFCMIGEYDREQENFREIACRSLDQGIDFYAGQTVPAPDGRRILIGWMQNPQTAEKRGVYFPINGQMSLPRELELHGDRILQKPVRELEEQRTDGIRFRDVKLRGEVRLEGIEGRTIDMEVSLRPDENAPHGEGTYEMFRMRFAGDEAHFTEFSYQPKTSVATIDRSRSGPGKTELVKAETEVRDRGGKLDIRLILDKLSAEIFINDGEQVMSAVIYTDRHAEEITFYVKGTAMMDIAKYRIKENQSWQVYH